MNTSSTAQPETESPLAVASMFGVGLGVITFALFPFLIPGLAVLALFAVPLLPLVVIVPALLVVSLVTRGTWRLAKRLVGRGQSSRNVRSSSRTRPGSASTSTSTM